MALKLKQDTGGEYELLPEGVYTARCIKVIDLGTQYSAMYDVRQPKLQLTWEILDDETKMADGRPFVISKEYTASLNEKATLYKDLVSWRGRKFSSEELVNFDVSNLLETYCALQVIHKDNSSGDKTYANVNTIMATKDRPEGVNDTVLFDISSPDMSIYDKLGTYMQGRIDNSEEFKAHKPETTTDTQVKIEDVGKPISLDDIPPQF